jgi:cell division protein FtsL
MKRGLFGTILWTALAACIGIGLFFVKHEVKDQERRLHALNTEIHRNQETIHVLRAEWSFLNDPGRLRAQAEKHLGMHPVKPTEVATLDSVLRDGMPSATMLAVAPLRQPGNPKPVPAARPASPPEKPPVKLADGQAKPPPPKSSGSAVANSEIPPPTAAATPAKGGRTIVVKSPALAENAGAQADGGSR